MGCDIHLLFEMKNLDGKWEQIPIDERLIPSDRNYGVFGFLADVRTRNDIESQFAGRGIPPDSLFENVINTLDYHSHTFAYLDEILNAPWERYELNDSYFYIFCRYILPKLASEKYYELHPVKYRDVRVIMAFDS